MLAVCISKSSLGTAGIPVIAWRRGPRGTLSALREANREEHWLQA